MFLQGVEDLLTLWRLIQQVWGVVLSVFGFFAGAAVIYLPGHFVGVPLTRRALDWYGLDDNVELPLLKVLDAAFALAGGFVGISVSGLGAFLTASEAIGAAATIAFGFAAQDVLSNFVSGAFIVLDPKFNIGDWIEWNGNEGVVEDISFRVTRVHTFDNELVTVPNATLAQATVTNPVAKDRRRVSYEFGIGYDDDIDEAVAVLVEEAENHPGILDRPLATVVVSELADSYVSLTVRFWIDQPQRTDFLSIRSEYVQAVKERFDAEGIEMPYPYRQLTGTVGTRVVDADAQTE
ncbi:MAG: mechanosensitive ion channel family protein [Haloferacaceae archaeon]